METMSLLWMVFRTLEHKKSALCLHYPKIIQMSFFLSCQVTLSEEYEYKKKNQSLRMPFNNDIKIYFSLIFKAKALQEKASF